MGNQLFVRCLKGSLLECEVLIINVYLHFKASYVHYKNSKCDTTVINDQSSVILPLLYVKEYLVIHFKNRISKCTNCLSLNEHLT